MLVPTLEFDLKDVAVWLGDIYEFLMSINVISGLQGLMGLAEISFLGAGVKGYII